MILDSSVIVALLKHEPEADSLIDVIVKNAGNLKMSTASYLETSIVVEGNKSAALSERLDRVLAELGIQFIPVSLDQARLAREAHQNFGRWSKNKAKLNFGDCLVYALARATGEPLLFKGHDFGETDIVAAR